MRNVTRAFARDYVERLNRAPEVDSVEMFFVMPPATLIRDMAELSSHPKLLIGAQNFCSASEGEFTGELSIAHLKEAGARILLTGHAERRLLFHETDEMVGTKLKRALAEKFYAVFCVGDLHRDQSDETLKAFLFEQLSAALNSVDQSDVQRLIIAYEPVWAIGSNAQGAASPERVGRSVGAIRSCVHTLFPSVSVPILYGGSVNDENCGDLMGYAGIDGLFIGRSAADPQNFLAIVRKALSKAASR